MRIVTIKSKSLKQYTEDKEMLQKASRPCVLVIRLRYKENRYDFAVPLRSNIAPSTPKTQYFALPPRSTTKDGYRHGIHYAKMFPVNKDSLIRFRTEGNESAERIKRIIDANEKEIIKECQDYLDEYAKGNIPKYATDIDWMLTLLKE